MQTKHTAENAEASAAKVTRKHRAIKHYDGIYLYRGWIIKRVNNNLLLDSEIRGNQWNTYKSFNDVKASSTTDIASTLRDAKMYIDQCVEMRAA